MSIRSLQRVQVVDSHTGGEPTRVVIDGGPDLGLGPLAERVIRFQRDFDRFRSAVVNEPRGHDAVVGALLCEPHEPNCEFGVIFFNNVGPIKMCVHGTIGLVVTLAHLGRTSSGECRIDTPVGVVSARLLPSGEVAVRNVASYRYASGVPIDVDGYGRMTGDIAWGGNWFFLVDDHGQQIHLSNIERLTDCAWRIRQSLERNRITGADGQLIDHIELFGPPEQRDANSKNFVLCPGKAYDRSPCGTGTSAKLACLHAAGKLQLGEVWTQESVVGSLFHGHLETAEGQLFPIIRGSAWVSAESVLLMDEADPFRDGIRYE